MENVKPAEHDQESTPVHLVNSDSLSDTLSKVSESAKRWVESNNFKAKPLSVLSVPDENGGLACVLFGSPDSDSRLGVGELAKRLPPGRFHLESGFTNKFQDTLAFALGGYKFDEYKADSQESFPILKIDPSLDFDEIKLIAEGVGLTRDLINTPAIDFGPEELAVQAGELFKTHGGSVRAIAGDELKNENFPLIHTVGQASDRIPRLIDLSWGNEDSPKVTLVGKGVCYDTGGLNLKPGNSMLLMKKDMGGAANVLGLASMIMAKQVPIRLRVLIPAVENVVSAKSYRPGDVLRSRKGLTVEIGNTDAEGRLVLADALTLADEESPDLLIDMATLTGAARVALGPEVPPFYTNDEAFAASIMKHSEQTEDPLWRMPLWKPYLKMMESKIADTNNVSSGSFAGSITAALFLSRFVEKSISWTHFDIFGWIPSEKPYGPVGGEAQCIRALYSMICERYG